MQNRRTLYIFAVCIVFFLTVMSGAASVFLSLCLEGQLDVHQISLIQTFSDTWKIGVGALIGLIGGRVT
jgi:hypothetical protein